jgi:hypothetical protein
VAEQPVRVTYDVRGAREGAAAVDELKRATLEHGQATEGAGRSAEGYERAVGNVRGQVEQLKQSQEAANRATVSAGQGFERLASNGIQLAQRFAGVSNAVGSLANQLGGSGSGSAFSLVGSIASSVAQFASLGSMLGPGGAVLGGIVGLTTAVSNLIAEHADGARAAREHAEALRGVANAAREAARAVSRGRDITFAVEEGGALGALALSDYSSSELTNEIGTRSARDAELDAERGRLAAQLETATGRGGGISGLDTGAIRERIAAIDEEVASNREVVRVLEDVIVAREREADAGRSGSGSGSSTTGTPPARRGGGRRRSGASAAEEPVDDGAFLERMAAETEAAGMARATEARERDRASFESYVAERRDLEAAAEAEKAAAVELFEADQEKRHERELERIAMERRARENLDRANMERLAQQTELLESIGDRIGGVFAGAFSAAIQGQEDFGQALAKGTKQVLIQFGTQMVAEGIGALFTGIGNTVLNPPAAATKLAEGAGKIALGVGLGAAGAAIPTGGGGASGARAERPRVDQAPSSGAQAQQLVINMNAPTVLGGTEAEFGRVMLRAGEAAARRFHGGRG